jgi:hypothetical protein
MTEGELFQALGVLYPAKSHALLPQVGNRTGANTSRHADAVAMGLWPSRGLVLEGFEIKCARGDWVRELAAPEKADAVCRWCDLWWVVVADREIVRAGELPPRWGLLAWDAKAGKLVKVTPAEQLVPEPLGRPFIAALLRGLHGVATPEAQLKAADGAGYARGVAAGAVQEKARQGWAAQDLAELTAQIRAFELASGVDLRQLRWEGEKIGAAVRVVLEGRATQAADAAEYRLQEIRRTAADVIARVDRALAETAVPVTPKGVF